MSELVGAIIGAVAIICIPLIGWFSRRATREGRLMLRVQRLGTVFALMPESSEKTEFQSHVTSSIARLNVWLDPNNVMRRKVIRGVSFGTYIVCVVVVFVAAPFINTAHTPWLTSVFGIILGAVISLITFGTSYLLERATKLKTKRAESEQAQAAADRRMEALARGEAPS